MATCENETTLIALELPREFEDLAGLVTTDMQAIVAMIAQRAHERLLLTGRQHHQLQVDLWNRLTEAVNETVEPLTADWR